MRALFFCYFVKIMKDKHFLKELTTSRLKLNKYQLAHAVEFTALLQDKDVAATTLMLPFPCSIKDARTLITRYIDEEKQKRSMRWAIMKEHQFMGGIRLVANTKFNSAEIGFWLGKKYWQNGYTFEAASEVIRFGFENLNLNRLEAHAMTENTSSIKLLERLGFNREGIHPDLVIKWGEYKDVITFGLLKRDYSKSDTSR